MDIIKFPGLGLDFEVSKVAFSLFGINIYNYAFCIVFGIIFALILCKNSKENYYIKFDALLEIMILALLVGIIGARLYFVIFNLEYYLENPIKIMNIRDGGLAIYGGLIAGVYVIIKRCKFYKIAPLDFLDYIVPFVAIAQAIGRWGNFFNIEAYGYETSSFLRMGITVAEGYKEVHPVFLYESISNFIIFFILRKAQEKRRFKGQILYMYMALYSGVRMFLETLRTDSLMFLGFRISQILSIVIFVYSSITLLMKYIDLAISKMYKVKKKK